MDNASFWADIKKFEDTLAKDPSSYCFAPLAELYRKTGLLDDAIATALKGTARQPQYVGGHMALGRAYLDKGMTAEALESLQRVVSFTPENMLAQKLLCQIYMDTGENDLLRKTLQTLLSLNAADAESRMLLESLDRMAPHTEKRESETEPATASANFMVEMSDDAGDVECLEELDLVDELEEVVDEVPPWPADEQQLSAFDDDSPPDSESIEEEDSAAGLHTATIAELYVAQGHIEQAVEMYRDMLLDNPDRGEYESRIAELERLLPVQEPLGASPLDDPWSMEEPGSPEIGDTADLAETVVLMSEPARVESNDGTLDELEGWLDNIRRVRECRSGRD